MKDDFNQPKDENEAFIDLLNLTKLWNIAFKKLILEEDRIFNYKLSQKFKVGKRRKPFKLNKISRLSIDNYLSNIKNLN